MTDPITVGKKIKEVEPLYKQYPDFLLGSLYMAKFGDPFKKDLVSPISKDSDLVGPESISPQIGKNLPNNISQWANLVSKYFPSDQINNALRIIQAESGGNPGIPSSFNKYGTEDSHGLFQINLQAHPQMRSTVTNPESNVAYAAQLYKNQGWRPWYNSARKLGLL